MHNNTNTPWAECDEIPSEPRLLCVGQITCVRLFGRVFRNLSFSSVHTISMRSKTQSSNRGPGKSRWIIRKETRWGNGCSHQHTHHVTLHSLQAALLCVCLESRVKQAMQQSAFKVRRTDGVWFQPIAGHQEWGKMISFPVLGEISALQATEPISAILLPSTRLTVCFESLSSSSWRILEFPSHWKTSCLRATLNTSALIPPSEDPGSARLLLKLL